MPSGGEHLTGDQVARILEIVQDADAILVGGQSVNLWAEHYAKDRPSLAARGPFTSKDIDFFKNPQAAEKLADALDGTLYVPEFDDATPNATLVIGMIDDRKIEIDFMETVLGVDERSIANNYVTLRGRHPSSGGEIRILLLDPLDCLRSRLANIRILKRNDDLSLAQARVAIDVLQFFIEDLLALGAWKKAQTILHDLYFLARDDFIRSPIALHHDINPIPAMSAFLDHPGLDERWRKLNLAKSIQRLEVMLARERNIAPGSHR